MALLRPRKRIHRGKIRQSLLQDISKVTAGFDGHEVIPFKCYRNLDAVARLEEVSNITRLPWEALHVAQLAQEVR